MRGEPSPCLPRGSPRTRRIFAMLEVIFIMETTRVVHVVFGVSPSTFPTLKPITLPIRFPRLNSLISHVIRSALPSRLYPTTRCGMCQNGFIVPAPQVYKYAGYDRLKAETAKNTPPARRVLCGKGRPRAFLAHLRSTPDNQAKVSAEKIGHMKPCCQYPLVAIVRSQGGHALARDGFVPCYPQDAGGGLARNAELRSYSKHAPGVAGGR